MVNDDARSTKLAKVHKHTARRIDLAVAALLAHALACQLDAATLMFRVPLRPFRPNGSRSPALY
jgi:hypothetical protein